MSDRAWLFWGFWLYGLGLVLLISESFQINPHLVAVFVGAVWFTVGAVLMARYLI